MHQSSYALMAKFSQRIQQKFRDQPVRILDVGSMGVNGTYKELFSFAGADYQGLDIAPGPNVDIVPKDPYAWSELEDNSFDVIVSGQALEHTEFPWRTIDEMARKLKPGGLVCLIAPSRGAEHRYPVDCYRYYPDGFRALARWAGLKVLEVDAVHGGSGFADGSDQWGDCHCVLTKEEHAAADPTPRRTENPARAASARRGGKHTRNPLNALQTQPYYRFTREEVVQVLVQHGIQARRVLELGCASGEVGKRIKQQMQAEYYAGIDCFEQAVQEARAKLDEVYLADMETTSAADLGLREKDFDLLVALDVLEHLRDPWEVLAELVECLKPGGHAVLSIPNIQNIGILTNLVHGKWTYESAGLLDVTHLRFFTMESIQDLVIGAGLTIVNATATLNPPLNLPDVLDAGNTYRHGKLSLSDLAREEVIRLFTYQYIVLAQRPA